MIYYVLATYTNKKIHKETYTSDCMQKRNQYMVDNSDILIAVWDKRIKGGTAKTFEYAQKTNKPVIIINPIELL